MNELLKETGEVSGISACNTCATTRRDENLSLLTKLKNGDKSAEEKLISNNEGLVRSLAVRFLGRGVEYEDIMQLGMIGMLKAIRSFDFERGCAFSTYAVPLIIGEIKRFLRDDGIIKVSRDKKRLGSQLLYEKEKYISTYGKEPRISELATLCGVDINEAAEALVSASSVKSLSDPAYDDSEQTVSDTLISPDELVSYTDKMALREVTAGMPELWRKIVSLRYYHDLSQQSTAKALGLTQVKISREEKKIFDYMRSALS